MFCKKVVYRNFVKFTGKHLCQSHFFNKAAGLRAATLLKKRLWHSCFPVNFTKFLRTPFIIEHLWWLLLILTCDDNCVVNSFVVTCTVYNLCSARMVNFQLFKWVSKDFLAGINFCKWGPTEKCRNINLSKNDKKFANIFTHKNFFFKTCILISLYGFM